MSCEFESRSGDQNFKTMNRYEVVEKENATHVRINGTTHVLFTDPFSEEDNFASSILVGKVHIDLATVISVLNVEVEFVREILPRKSEATLIVLPVSDSIGVKYKLDRIPTEPGTYHVEIIEVFTDEDEN